MSQKIERVKALDGLRGLAAFSVVVLHLTSPKLQPYLRQESIPNNWFHFSYGHYAVELFFILSGFLILLSLERSKSLKNFLVSRFVRLYPTFWLCLLFSVLIVLTVYPGPKEIDLNVFVANLTMLPKQFLGNDSYIEGQWWTLEYEIYFYLFSSVIFFRFGKVYVPIFLMLSALIGSLFQIANVFSRLEFLPPLISAIIMRCYGYCLLEYSHLFLIGILFFLYFKTLDKIYIYFLVLPILSAFTFSVEHGLFVGCLVLIFHFSLTSKFGWLVSLPPFLWLGKISFPLYLIHLNLGYSIISIVNIYFKQTVLLSVLSGIFVVLITSCLITFLLNFILRTRLLIYSQKA
jgi:peptidoglycan/LPS O-acetylase OafA/YrhL